MHWIFCGFLEIWASLLLKVLQFWNFIGDMHCCTHWQMWVTDKQKEHRWIIKQQHQIQELRTVMNSKLNLSSTVLTDLGCVSQKHHKPKRRMHYCPHLQSGGIKASCQKSKPFWRLLDSLSNVLCSHSVLCCFSCRLWICPFGEH